MSLLGWKVSWKNSFRDFRGTVVHESTSEGLLINDELLNEAIKVPSATRFTKLGFNLAVYVDYWKNADSSTSVSRLLNSLEMHSSDVMMKKQIMVIYQNTKIVYTLYG